MAVASDLPQLENKAEYKKARNSTVYADAKGKQELATLTGNQNRILVSTHEISPNIKNAVIAVEDRRFWEHEGVDYKGIARAVLQDVRRQKAVQGGSTITQQFVKNALAAQGNRSVFQKLREAARRLPPRAKVAEAEGPHPVPEQRLLRQRRLRRRSGRSHLLQK